LTDDTNQSKVESMKGKITITLQRPNGHTTKVSTKAPISDDDIALTERLIEQLTADKPAETRTEPMKVMIDPASISPELDVMCMSIVKHVTNAGASGELLTLTRLEKRVAGDLGKAPAQIRTRFHAAMHILHGARIVMHRKHLGSTQTYFLVEGATYP
jgi:hypothetical protein